MYELELKERERLEEMLKKREQALEDASVGLEWGICVNDWI